MPDLLLELFSEEIPARMQARAADDLQRLITEALTLAGLTVGESETYSGPRRLTLIIKDLPALSESKIEERKGPRAGAPEKAVAGFLRAAGLQSLDECEVVSDPKGDYYVARTEKPGQPASEIVAQAVAGTVQRFPWPKSMRWGSGKLRWVRPLHAIVCLLDGEVVPLEVDGLNSGNTTYGHRFLSGKRATEPETIVIKSIKDYASALLHAKVVTSRNTRAEQILTGAKQLASDASLDLVEDHGLLDENAGLVEWPVVYSGTFAESFLDVPPEILMTSMKTHQKCFSLKNPKTGALANRFILVSNLEAEDGGKAIISGNERVIRARLSDAKFFWENDKTRKLDDLVPLLGHVTFHEKLGTQLERVERVESLAREVAPLVGADPNRSGEAARLAKADLTSETVGEFPELQGVIGRYIALAQGREADVADAIASHYKPQGPSDEVPANPVSVAVALADKIDMLVGFWAIDEKPTGSKDPFALRRAALGVIRIVLENGLRISLSPQLLAHHPRLYQRASLAFQLITRLPDSTFEYPAFWRNLPWPRTTAAGEEVWPVDEFDFARDQDIWVLSEAVLPHQADDHFSMQIFKHKGQTVVDRVQKIEKECFQIKSATEVSEQLLAFFADRLKVYLRDKGARYDLIDAVFALPGQDDLLLIVRRVEALGRFLETDDGANLLAGVKRAQNILRIEEKKDNARYDATPVSKLLKDKHEKALNKAIGEVRTEVEAALKAEDFERAMAALARLRAPVDTFFDKVTVNADEPELRVNRLNLLGQIRALTLEIADFTKIEG